MPQLSVSFLTSLQLRAAGIRIVAGEGKGGTAFIPPDLVRRHLRYLEPFQFQGCLSVAVRN